jgi:hypothetical protein
MKNKKRRDNYLKTFFARNCKGNWDSFESFCSEVGIPTSNRAKLSRTCLQKGFVPGNLQWANVVNYKSKYMITTTQGNVASLRAACEQDGINYSGPAIFMHNYPDMKTAPQEVYRYFKMSRASRMAFKRNVFKKAIREAQFV